MQRAVAHLDFLVPDVLPDDWRGADVAHDAQNAISIVRVKTFGVGDSHGLHPLGKIWVRQPSGHAQ